MIDLDEEISVVIVLLLDSVGMTKVEVDQVEDDQDEHACNTPVD
jgi:hypothetical protein